MKLLNYLIKGNRLFDLSKMEKMRALCSSVDDLNSSMSCLALSLEASNAKLRAVPSAAICRWYSKVAAWFSRIDVCISDQFAIDLATFAEFSVRLPMVSSVFSCQTWDCRNWHML